MITKAILLFLLGTAMASELFMNKLQSPYEVAVVPYKSSGCPTAADWAPLICKFLQTNMDLYYKPQLIAPSTYIPPLVIQKCETPEIKVDLELPAQVEEKRPASIPQPPELPPLTIRKFPVPVIVEEFPKKGNEPSDIPETPELAIPGTSRIFEQPKPYYFFKEAIPEIDTNGIDEKPMMIPQPPELPEFTMPELPGHVEIPSGPLPEMDISAPHNMITEKPTEEPHLSEKITPEIDYNLGKFESISIPQPPELTDFVMPELPAIPTYYESKPIADSPLQAEFKPLAILPAASELPPAKLPEFPVSVEMPSAPVLPSGDLSQPIVVMEQPKEEPCLKEETAKYDSEYKHIVIPQPPELPAFVMPELSTLRFEQEPIKTYYESFAPLPAAPELPASSLPEFPFNIEIPSAPALPAMDISSPRNFEEQPLTGIDYSMLNRATISIPAPPELPAFVMPELPLNFEQEPIKTYYEPLALLPGAPEKPAAKLPESSFNVEVPSAPALPTMEMDKPSPPMAEEQPLPEIDYNMIYRAPISIPAPPELPAFIMPELPLNFEQEPIKTYHEPLANLPATPEKPAAKLPESSFNVEVPSAPALPTMETDKPSPPMAEEQPLPEIDYNMIYRAPISIPAPPELPAFIKPELPFNFEQEPIKTNYEPLANLPAAPEKPAAYSPEAPFYFQIPYAPALPAIDMRSPTMAEEQPLPEIDYNMIYRAPIAIPTRPELPAFLMPELPLNFEQKPMKTYYEPPTSMPAAPELPATKLPEFPVNVEIPAAPALPDIDIPSPTMAEEQPIPEIDYNMIYRAPISIPAPPELPAFKMPELPFKIEEHPMVALTPEPASAPKLSEFKPDFPAILSTFINKPCDTSGKHEVAFDTMPNPYGQRYYNEKVKESHNIILIPTKSMNQEYIHSPCVYNLVMQHVLPNIASDHFRSLEKIKALPRTLLPCA